MKNHKYAALAAYLATIPAANWMISHVGVQEFPAGPHTIPVGLGYRAPSGVLMIGIALVARDIVQEHFGKRITVAAICAGIALSYLINPAIAVASAVAFALGEMSDFAIYSRLRKNSLTWAVVASGLVGGVIDSFVFLQIAFGSVNYWQGQVLGKALMAIAAGGLIAVSRAVSQRMSPVSA